MKHSLKANILVFLLLTTVGYAAMPPTLPSKIKFTAVDDPTGQQALLIKLLKSSGTPELKYDVVKSIPHDINSFTEGLLIDNDTLYESAGMYKQSRITISKLDNAMPIKRYMMDPNYFAEGIAILDDQLYQLSYREHTAFVYDKNTLQLKKTFTFAGEGWGLASYDKTLMMSNGTADIYFINPNNFNIERTLTVTDRAKNEIGALNELEYINGKIYANIWPTDIIVVIAPQNGVIEAWFNIHSLKPKRELEASDNTSNGIAYDARSGNLLVTGKDWPYLYFIKLHSAAMNVNRD